MFATRPGAMRPAARPGTPDALAHLKHLRAAYAEARATTSGLSSLIDLSLAHPDLGPDARWRERLADQVLAATQHGYGDVHRDANLLLRRRFVAYYTRRFGPVSLDPMRNVVDLRGAKEGLFHALFTLLAPGDAVLLPNPGVPAYAACAHAIGARVEWFDCDAEGLPDVDALRTRQLRRAKVLVVCSPGNPTGVLVARRALQRLVDFAAEHDLVLLLDRAYAEIVPERSTQGGHLPGGALALPGAMSRVVELHSLSKSCGIAGWRVGFAVGAERVVRRIAAHKADTDYGLFLPMQQVVAQMLDELESIATVNARRYRARMTRFVSTLQAAGWETAKPGGAFFLWARLPWTFRDLGDAAFVERVLWDTGVLLAPGSGFGSNGAGHVRLAMVHDESVLAVAAERLARWLVETRLAPAFDDVPSLPERHVP